jgi:transcriptional regulator with XRE-family HTH domain
MPKNPTVAANNVFCIARKEAASFNDTLNSREGAAELLGIDRTRLARIELGSLNPYPEEVLLMSDAYNAPELNNHYCTQLCPLGRKTVQPAQLLQLDRLTIKIIAALGEAEYIPETIVKIVQDGIISEDEKPQEEAQQRAGAARENHNRRADFEKVPVRKNLLLTCYAFRKTAALLFTIAAITIAGQALNEQASGIDIQHQEQTPSATPATVTNQTAYIARETAARSMTSSRPVPTAEATPTQEPTPEPNPTVRIYDIPLSEELQAFTFNLCEEYGVDYEMVLAIMDKESDYTASAISKSSDYGIMQINKINHKWLTEELEVTDFLDPEQNIRCGIYMLADLMKKYDDPHRVLMAYNMGERGAREYVAKGNTSSAYSRYIMQLRDKLLQEGGKE